MNSSVRPVPERHPVLSLLARYRAIFATAWSMRKELAAPTRSADATAFLPGALSLQDTPPHPAPRRVAWVICALFAIALAWAVFGQIDIVATASGRIVVSDRSKTVQPLETSVVRKVLVKDGDAVQAGQILVELDATATSADSASLGEQLKAARSEERRTSALQAALRSDRPPALAPVPKSEPSDGDDAVRLQLQAEWDDVSAKFAKLAAEQAHRAAEVVTVQALVAKLEATLPLAKQREADFRSLTAQGFISSHAEQDRTRERIEQERDLAMQRARLSETRAGLSEAQRARAAYGAEALRLLSDRHAQAVLKRQQLVQELSKNEQRSRLTQLAAPVAGTVQQVAVHTEGGVVTPAQVLMIVVPKDAVVTAEVTVDNKDIGFVNAGDAAEIKLETFPFTRYGTVPATVRSLTADAVNDEKRGAIFPAVLTLGRSRIDVDGKTINLSPGMNVTAEIKTGKRRVIEYLTSPLQKSATESLKER